MGAWLLVGIKKQYNLKTVGPAEKQRSKKRRAQQPKDKTAIGIQLFQDANHSFTELR